MNRNGEITVFLTLIFLSICSLLCVLAESARTAGARYYARQALNSSMDSLFAQYHLELWERYQVLGLEYQQEEDLETEFQGFLETYLKADNWYPYKDHQVNLTELVNLTDQGGAGMRSQVLSYMTYGLLDLDLEDAQGQLGQLGQMEEALTQAQAVQQVSEEYQKHSKDAVKMERALEQIARILNQQREAWDGGLDALKEMDGREFLNRAEEVNQALEQIPEAVAEYEALADQLEQGLAESMEAGQDLKEDMGEELESQVSSGLSGYLDYSEQDGARREETNNLIEDSEECRQYVDSVMDEAEDVIEYIKDWEASDDEDELDEEELWEEVEDSWKGCPLVELKASHGIGDKEKEGALERVGELVQGNLLKMLMPKDGVVSSRKPDLQDAPSREHGGYGQPESSSFVDRMKMAVYTLRYFTIYEKTPSQEGSCAYETEYILYGEETDQENLAAAVTRLVLIREGLNLIHILSDSTKRQAAHSLALVVVGGLGIPPLVEIMAFFVMAVWALGEAMMDVQGLLNGEKIPLLKTAQEWQLGLEGLLNMGRTGTVARETKEDARGLDYSQYIQLFLFIGSGSDCDLRMMDLMQANLRQEQPGFRMDHCVYEAGIETVLCGRHLWALGGFGREYQMSMSVTGSYE